MVTLPVFVSLVVSACCGVIMLACSMIVPVVNSTFMYMQALQAGQLMEKRQRDCLLNDTDGPLSKVRCRAAPRSSMPYSTYWARKIAI